MIEGYVDLKSITTALSCSEGLGSSASPPSNCISVELLTSPSGVLCKRHEGWSDNAPACKGILIDFNSNRHDQLSCMRVRPRTSLPGLQDAVVNLSCTAPVVGRCAQMRCSVQKAIQAVLLRSQLP